MDLILKEILENYKSMGLYVFYKACSRWNSILNILVPRFLLAVV